jgi:hypothetical protein
MVVTLEIPDDVAAQLGNDLPRQALEALALEGYKTGRITKTQLRNSLGLSRYELDGFLKKHDIYEGPTYEEVMQQVEALDRLGF